MADVQRQILGELTKIRKLLESVIGEADRVDQNDPMRNIVGMQNLTAEELFKNVAGGVNLSPQQIKELGIEETPQASSMQLADVMKAAQEKKDK